MDKHIRIASFMTRLLDSKFHLGKLRFGLDPILGILPGIGDIIPIALSAYIIWIATQLKASDEDIGQMIKHVVYDLVIGMVPIVGDIGDIFYKANTKNLAILKKFTDTKIIEGEVIA